MLLANQVTPYALLSSGSTNQRVEQRLLLTVQYFWLLDKNSIAREHPHIFSMIVLPNN